MKVIGLTGGTGSGKTTAAEYLQGKGYRVFSADIIAREIMEPGQKALKETVETFGKDILDDEGRLKRKLLAAIVFNDEENLAKLNDISHKAIFSAMEDKVHRAKSDYIEGSYDRDAVFLDAPLLFESGLDKITHENWLVIAGRDVRADRVARRDGVSKEDVFAIMKNQMSDREKIKRTDYILNNRGTVDDFYAAIDKLLHMER